MSEEPIGKVVPVTAHSGVSVYDMNREQFLDALAVKTTAREVFADAPRIYEFLTTLFGEDCNDSVLREWAFQWYCEVTGDEYDSIYNRWLED